MLVCSECNNKDPCTCEDGETRAVFCESSPQQELIWAEWREYIMGDVLFQDPQGRPYVVAPSFMQTLITDPMKPKPAEELYTEAQKKHKICNEK